MTELQSSRPNRRRRIRHKVLTPAYASFMGDSKAVTLDLNEIVDISEDGVAVQCKSALELNGKFELCLDLAESSSPIYTTAQVIWSSTSGRSGFRFSDLPSTSLVSLREWLFLNAMAGVANAQSDAAVLPAISEPQTPLRPNYTDTLAALGAVQREVEALGSDLVAALRLIAVRAQALLRASGAAIALASDDPNVMVCRASSGVDAPPVGAKLQVGSGFSGECVRSAKLLRCDDSETDVRVDRESCRALGIRSMLAAPVSTGEKVIGIIEVFGSAPSAFNDNDNTALQRLADTVVAAVNRTARAQDSPTASSTSRAPMSSSSASVLFASEPAQGDKKDLEEKAAGGIRLPRSQLIILICAAAAISLAMGFLLRSWNEEKLHTNRANREHTVLAASRPVVKSATPPIHSDAEIASQIMERARQGDASAQYSLGRRYNLGDGVRKDYAEAARWFSRAADQGHVLAQGALGDYYNYGRGVPVDLSKAYFWSYLAFAGGDEVSKLRLGRLAGQLPHSQIVRVQQQAEAWFHQHPVPSPTH